MDLNPNLGPDLAPGALSFSFDDYSTSNRIDQLCKLNDPRGSDSVRNGVHHSSAAASLPTEVIQQILYLADPETFTSLLLVSRAFRSAAEDPQIYAHHLSRSTHSVLLGPFSSADLLHFKRQLVQEAKRNLFAVFMRPRQTIINLISTTTSSSAAFPYGEGFEFLFSYRAQWCLAISSSRIIVIDTAAENVAVVRELKVVRRPLSAYILADGSCLAVLAANHKVNIYDLTEKKAVFKRSIELDETAHTITMTMGGEVLAAGCEGGVEVVSLAEDGPHTAKRVIKCDRVDNLSFSSDGTMLLGTTHQSRTPSTVILTAPYFTDFSEHEMDHTELLSHLWTSQIIFPNSSRDCSHAALLPRKQDQDANWTLTYDRVFESFRAVRSDDLRNGTTYFTGPEPKQQKQRQRSKSSLTPRTLPAITPQGELVAAAFLTSEIWLYGVPDDLEHSGVKYENARVGTPNHSPAASTESTPRSSRREIERMPRWQVLVDKYRNVFAKGRKVANVAGASNICWSVPDPAERGSHNIKERLVIAAPGGVSELNSDLQEEDLACVDGGRLVVLDFNWGPRSGEKSEITIDVGSAEPQLLEEEDMDMDTEIAVVRRRTLARRDGATRSYVSTVADILRPQGVEDAPPIPPVPQAVGFGLDLRDTSETQATAEPTPAIPEDEDEHGVSLEEAIEGLDGPYSHTSPRSRGTVYRSAAAVEANRRRMPPAHPAQGPVEYRRTDGTELPHESDADNWVPPPPAYGNHVDDEALSDIRRRSLVPQNSQGSQGSTGAVSPMASERMSTQRHPAVSTDLSRRRTEARRRSSADIEGSRWFSRHEINCATSPALDYDETIQRSQSHRHSPSAPSTPTNTSRTSSPRRPLSSYEPRSSLYRAALQPAASISPIPEPASAQAQQPPRSPTSQGRRTTSLTLSGTNLQQRLDYPLPPPPPGAGDDEPSPIATAQRTPTRLLSPIDSGREPAPNMHHPPRTSSRRLPSYSLAP